MTMGQMDGVSQPDAPGSGARTRRRRWFIVGAALLSLTLSLAAAELLLRISGHRPWQPCGDPNEPVLYQPDPELGWRAKAGRYALPGYPRGSPDTHMTILPDGARDTGPPGVGGPAVAFLGCSFTQGVAISDEDTFTWKLQQRFPSWRVRNLGTGAYGTFQALLLLQRILAQPDPPQTVVYGFIDPHEMRNVAHPVWINMLALCSRRGMVYTPYGTLDAAGHLVRHPPESYPMWPLREQLATVAFLQDLYAYYRLRDRPAQKRTVTEQLLVEMDRVAKQHGVRLLIALLYFSPAAPDARAHYTELLQRHGIDFVDCAYPMTRDMKVPVEGHPNGAMNSRWADCIAAKLGPEATGAS